MAKTDWTSALDRTLTGLWNEGLSAAQIGQRMGMTKNAIVGRAHRLKLPARPSPIRSTLRSENAAARRAEQLQHARTMHGEGHTDRQIAARLGVRVDKAANMLRGMGLASHAQKPMAVGQGLPVVDVPPAAPAAPAVAFKPIAARSCCWPMWGDKERPTHRYCGAATTTRRDGVPDVYCAAHRQRSTARTMHPVTAPRYAA